MGSWSLACCCGPGGNECPSQNQWCEPITQRFPAEDFDGVFQGSRALASLLDRVEVEALACEKATAEMAPGLLAMASFQSIEDADAIGTITRSGRKLSDHIAAESLGDLSVRFMSCELIAATNNFDIENELGSGTFGKVYSGRLWSGTAVAVKVLPGANEENGFEDEVRVLSRLRHPNLVTLLGWGQDYNGDTRFLVYELLLGGDVGMRLTRCKLGHCDFFWHDRLRVSVDAVRGLSYMVNSTPKVFHRDIKPPNILLDARGDAKVSDFGLARVAQDIWASHMSIRDGAGTPGYISPELIHTGEVTEQSEVYSFGIVFLELLVNILPATATLEGTIVHPISDVVRPNASGALTRVLKNLDICADWPLPITEQIALFALDCIHEQPSRRPSFRSIVSDLEWAHENALNTVTPVLKSGNARGNANHQAYAQRAAPCSNHSAPSTSPPQRSCPAYSGSAAALGSSRLCTLREETDEDSVASPSGVTPDTGRLRDALFISSVICEIANANHNTPESVINTWPLPKANADASAQRPQQSCPPGPGISAWAKRMRVEPIGSVSSMLQPTVQHVRKGAVLR